MEQTVKKGNRTANPAFTLKTHRDLPRMSEAEIRENATQFLKNADHGIQTAVCGSDGATLRSVIGLNGFRYHPDPTPDPLDEIVRMALE